MSDSFFDIYQNFESAKELWDSLESKYMAEDAYSKKFLVSNFMGYKMIDSRPVMEQFHEMLRILGQFSQHNLKMDEAIYVVVIIDKLPPSWKDFKHNLKHNKEELILTQLGSHLRIEESIRTQELDNNPKGKNQVGSSSVNMVEGESSKNPKKSNAKRNFKGKDDKSSNKKAKLVCWNCNKPGHFKKDCHLRKVNKDGAGPSGSKDPKKQQCQISISMQNSKYVQNYISKAFYVQDDDVAWWVDSGATSHICKDLRWFKECQPIEDGFVVKMGNVTTEPIKGLGSILLYFNYGKCLCVNNVLYVPGIQKNLVSEIVLNNCGYKQVLESDKYYYVYLLHSKDEALDKFKIYKQQVELHKNELIKVLRTDRGAERKNRKEMVNSMFSYFGLSEGFWGEAMLTACYILNKTPNKRSKNTPYELWCKMVPTLSYLKVYGCRAVVRLTEPKRKTVGERGVDCIFIGYAEHSKAYRFYVLESNNSVYVNTVIESRDAIFDEERFTSIPITRDTSHQSSSNSITQAKDVYVGASSVPEPRKSTRARKAKSFGSDFQVYLVEGTWNETICQHQYCFNIKEDPKTFSEAMASRDVLLDLPLGCKALGSKWILKRKMKVDDTIDKYKARLVIQDFRQKEGIDFFDTYAPVSRISTIRLLLSLAAIHNLVIHQMDVKTAFLNGDLDEEIYIKQPEGFVMPGNEHKADKCVYSKFYSSGKGVIICLYVDDMLIFGTDQGEVDKTKKFLSSTFDMKDMGEDEVILGIRIRKGNNGISISQSHYIEKILKKFNFENCSPVSTAIDPSLKLLLNKGSPVSQLEYSRAIGCLIYAMISTRPDITYVMGRLSRYTSNPSSHHWQTVSRVFKYLKGTINYGLIYSGYPSILEGYLDARWINNLEDHSSTSGWVFLLD
uniref:CCHC-type domain-containing protein n=1 Tax=Lactuca sativa TaxID=4236 RepID=A0A9R1UI26_LACSA|nr:hypothetical protein LSAT_V11C900477740 [Lactuca sativa]